MEQGKREEGGEGQSFATTIKIIITVMAIMVIITTIMIVMIIHSPCR